MVKGLKRTNTRRKAKYKSESCYCRQKHWHQSRAEAHRCNELAIMTRCRPKLVKEYRTQVKYEMVVNGKHICNHIVDFDVVGRRAVNDNWSHWVEDVKGFGTKEWVIKKKLFEALYPNIPYVVKRAR